MRLFMILLLVIVLLSAVAYAQVPGASAMEKALQPLGDLIKGLFKIFSDNPKQWISIVFGVLVAVILYALTEIIPGIKSSQTLRLVGSIAVAVGVGVLFKPEFFATILGGFFMYGLAILIGFSFLGTVWMLWEHSINAAWLQGHGRILNSVRYIIPILILLAFGGLLSILSGSLTAGVGPTVFSGSGIPGLSSLPSFVTVLFEVINGIISLAVVVLFILALVALFAGGAGAVRAGAPAAWGAGKQLGGRAAGWFGGGSRELNDIEGLVVLLNQVRAELRNAIAAGQANTGDLFREGVRKVASDLTRGLAIDRLLQNEVRRDERLDRDARVNLLASVRGMFVSMRRNVQRLEGASRSTVLAQGVQEARRAQDELFEAEPNVLQFAQGIVAMLRGG